MRAVSLLPVEEFVLCHIDTIRYQGSQDTNNGNQYPSLCSVEPCSDPPADIFAAPEGLHTIGIGDGIVNPIGGGKLVVPNSVMLPKGVLGRA